ncbi:hypothetical protein ABS755_08110 [Castellaniella sp. FW104-16D08]|uniref:DUF7940 domain-containing protein n=1 Tax=unclassified Castellaniella TaxID=2617606 RepID=UPI0033151EF9
MKLIPEWRQCHRFWSVRLQAVGVALITFVQGFPDAFIHVWAVLPPDVTAAFPADTVKWLGIAVLACGIVARIIRQDKLHAPRVGGEGKPRVSCEGR